MIEETRATAAHTERVLPPVDFTEFHLPNGLRVILHEDQSVPVVAVNLWYHVGSKDEAQGRTGFAHLFEHMMFQGSKNYDDDFFKPLQEAGGTLNGSTNSDRTNYWEVVPSNFLELAIFLEADRMGNLLDAMTEEKLNNQRDVVKNEKRQNYDNQPYGLVSAKIAETIYPPEHPYSWITIGSLDDLTKASLDDVKDFFRRFYTPNNASLVVAGNFQTEDARRLVEKHFGSVPRGPEKQRIVLPQPQLDGEIRLEMGDKVALSRIYIVWHTTPQMTADDAALDMLASVLAGGKSSRLYHSLVYESQIAQSITAYQSSREIAGHFQIIATAKPGKTLDELEAAINCEIERIKIEPPTIEEITRYKNAYEASFIYSLQSLGGFGGKSDQLNLYATYLDRPDYFEEDLARYAQVTPEDVQRVARTYLNDKRLVLGVLKREEGTKASEAENQNTPSGIALPNKATLAATPSEAAPPASVAHNISDAVVPAAAHVHKTFKLPQPAPDPEFNLPPLNRFRLSNDLDVLLVEHRALPVVTMNMVVKAGAGSDPSSRAGIASFTADMLDEGTERRNALEISDELAALGARLGTGAGWDASIATLLTLTKHLDQALDVYGDVIASPAFPATDLERVRATRIAALQQRRDNATIIAETIFPQLLYGRDHAYGHPMIGDADSLRSISKQDVSNFHATFHRPNNSTLVVVGDTQADQLIPKLEASFASWHAAEKIEPTADDIPSAQQRGLYLIDRPGAAQSVIVTGRVAVARSTPDYFPLLLLNTILGGQFTSRINLNLREDKGYTYGARTAFSFRRAEGPFIASASVHTHTTVEAVREIIKELRDVRGSRPVTNEELEFAKKGIIRGLPRGFETPAQVADRMTDIALYDLPMDYFDNYIESVRAVKIDDINRVAQKYLDTSEMITLVVGDRAVVETNLRALDELAGQTLVMLDVEGREVESLK
ncbi:MAG: insulinase family protein [Pyrinomonadaceae bacterium]|nr:insulinase family protein [Pyrinomonadaceae bacterium]